MTESSSNPVTDDPSDPTAADAPSVVSLWSSYSQE